MPMFHGRFAEGPQYDESSYAKAMVDHATDLISELFPLQMSLYVTCQNSSKP